MVDLSEASQIEHFVILTESRYIWVECHCIDHTQAFACAALTRSTSVLLLAHKSVPALDLSIIGMDMTC